MGEDGRHDLSSDKPYREVEIFPMGLCVCDLNFILNMYQQKVPLEEILSAKSGNTDKRLITYTENLIINGLTHVARDQIQNQLLL